MSSIFVSSLITWCCTNVCLEKEEKKEEIKKSNIPSIFKGAVMIPEIFVYACVCMCACPWVCMLCVLERQEKIKHYKERKYEKIQKSISQTFPNLNSRCYNITY